MPSVPQGQDELQQHLTEHLNFIKRSGKAYDQGYGDEAKRLATSIRVLVHDTSMSRSLLAQLGLKDIQFLASGHQLNPESFMTFSALTQVMATKQGAVHEPLLDSGPPI